MAGHRHAAAVRLHGGGDGAAVAQGRRRRGGGRRGAGRDRDRQGEHGLRVRLRPGRWSRSWRRRATRCRSGTRSRGSEMLLRWSRGAAEGARPGNTHHPQKSRAPTVRMAQRCLAPPPSAPAGAPAAAPGRRPPPRPQPLPQPQLGVTDASRRLPSPSASRATGGWTCMGSPGRARAGGSSRPTSSGRSPPALRAVQPPAAPASPAPAAAPRWADSGRRREARDGQGAGSGRRAHQAAADGRAADGRVQGDRAALLSAGRDRHDRRGRRARRSSRRWPRRARRSRPSTTWSSRPAPSRCASFPAPTAPTATGASSSTRGSTSGSRSPPRMPWSCRPSSTPTSRGCARSPPRPGRSRPASGTGRSRRPSSRAGRSPSPTSACTESPTSSAVINTPQAGILAVGELKAKPVVTDSGEIEARQLMGVTLACDHRILYGADGAQFLARSRAARERSGSRSSWRRRRGRPARRLDRGTSAPGDAGTDAWRAVHRGRSYSTAPTRAAPRPRRDREMWEEERSGRRGFEMTVRSSRSRATPESSGSRPTRATAAEGVPDLWVVRSRPASARTSRSGRSGRRPGGSPAAGA